MRVAAAMRWMECQIAPRSKQSSKDGKREGDNVVHGIQFFIVDSGFVFYPNQTPMETISAATFCADRHKHDCRPPYLYMDTPHIHLPTPDAQVDKRV